MVLICTFNVMVCWQHHTCASLYLNVCAYCMYVFECFVFVCANCSKKIDSSIHKDQFSVDVGLNSALFILIKKYR